MKTKTMRKRVGSLPFVLLFVGACGSRSHHGAGGAGARAGAGDDGVTVRANLTASTTLAQALAGKIQPVVGAPGNLISASTAGEPSVGDDGSASYSVPIWVPAGINGLQPSLAVQYNSEGGIGLLGLRWRLSGLSTITHCAKVRAIDGVQKPVELYGDTFCLDGQRLLRQAGTDVFRPERDTYAKIVGTRDANGDFVSFKVYQRDGLILSYGRTLASRLHGSPRAFSGGHSREAFYAFYVDKIEDRYTNSILITYLNATTSSAGDVVRELVPGTITWGSTEETGGQRSVSFSYETATDIAQFWGLAVDNSARRYVSGLGIDNGRYLRSLTIKGPDGLGGTPVLKTYTFTYDTKASPTGPQIVTGDRVLTSISECDVSGVCKKPTTIQWEPGTLAYTAVPFANTSDVNLTGYGAPGIYDGDFSESYRRVLAADLDGDGRDDIVYRGFNPPHHSGSFDCLGWKARLATLVAGDFSGIPVLGNPTDLPMLGANQDISCDQRYPEGQDPARWSTSSWLAGQAYPGDLIISDLDRDGTPDFLTPLGDGLRTGVPRFYDYRAYLNKWPNIDPPIDFLDSFGEYYPTAIGNHSTVRSALVAVGDIDGDGFPDIIRPTENPSLHLAAATMAYPAAITLRTGTVRVGNEGAELPLTWSECTDPAKCNKSISDMPWFDGTTSIRDVAAVDLDGDGTAEIIRNATSCISLSGLPDICGGVASVLSPTMNGMIQLVPATGGGAGMARWFADLNGDGLPDLVWVDPTVPSKIWTSMNSGQGFVGYTSMDLPAGARITGAGARDGGVRILDFNQDGRQDLLLVVSDASQTMPVLLSTGLGTFTVQDSGLPGLGHTGGPGSGPYATHALVADMNADGLPDVVNLSTGGLIGYFRQGKAPAMVTSIVEGTGRNVLFSYDVSSDTPSGSGVPQFYTTFSNFTCGTDKQRLECLKKGRWLTKALTISGPDIPFAATQTFTYVGGVSDKNGRGFLGFMRRDIYGPGSRHTRITYDPLTRLISSAHYAYPYALLPKTIRVDVDTLEVNDSHHFSNETNIYDAAFRDDGTFVPVPSETDREMYDCMTTSGRICNGEPRLLGSQVETFVVDSYGNLTSHGITYKGEGGTVIQVDSEAAHFKAPTENWLISLYDPAQNSTRTSSAGGVSKTRTIKVTPDTVHGGVTSIEIEPNGDSTTRLKRTFWRDERGRLTAIQETDVVAGVDRWPASLISYEDADGVDVSSVYDARSLRTRIWRHPGLGLVVEVNDPNGFVETHTYDTFGRVLNNTKPTGEYTNLLYLDGPGIGADVQINRSGLTWRKRHTDSYGRETNLVSGLDVNRDLGESTTYDAMGRVRTKTIASLPTAGGYVELNMSVLTFDDMNRLVSDCHLSSDGLNHCKTNAYDGLAATSTDEAGRAVSFVTDAMGRQISQGAVLPSSVFTNSAIFQYGPFGLLTQEYTKDLNAQGIAEVKGQTDIGYDVLGRQVSITRKGVGIRGIRYNPFGDVVETYKQKSDLTKVDSIIYGRDNLGRVTSVNGPGIQRSFYWDAPAMYYGGTTPNVIGKLVDVIEGDPYFPTTQIHYEYGSNGLLSQKTWSAVTFGAMEWFAMQFGYDSIGRPSTVTYPGNMNASDPVKIRYDYFSFNGAVSSLTDASNNRGIWAATAWNERGQFTGEGMGMPGGPTISKSTSYNLATGLPVGLDMVGADRFAHYTYGYDAGGLPTTFGSAGSAGGTWSSSFTYDNLSRLKSWLPATGAHTVTFLYDSDGNLTQRAWSGETVNYGTTTSARTVDVLQGGVTVRSDSYQFDQWGRIFDTPAVSLTYDALDSVTSVTEKATGRYDMFINDGFGKRLYSAYGNPFDGQPFRQLWQLDDLYEFSTNGTNVEERCHLRANGKLVGDIVRTSSGGPRTATFYLTDAVGSVLTEASSTTGALTARTRRDPFGNALPGPTAPYLPTDPSGTDPDGSSRMAYADHPREAGLGFVDMGARFYSPRLGRFISPDSVVAHGADRRDYNPFAYAWNNPVAMADPTGHSVIDVLRYLFSGGTPGPGYTGTDTDSLPHSLQNPSAGYDGGQSPGGYSPSSGCGGGCGARSYGGVPAAPPPPPPPNPVVRMPDNVAVASSTSDGGGNTANLNLRNSGATEQAGSIFVLKMAKLVASAGGWLFDSVLKPKMMFEIAIWGERGGEPIDFLLNGIRGVNLGKFAWGPNSTLFKVVDNGGAALKVLSEKVISPAMTAYHATELVDMVSQGRWDDALIAAGHIAGDWTPGWDLIVDGPLLERIDCRGSKRFDNDAIRSPWRRDEFPAQSLQREQGGQSDARDYTDPFGS